MNKIPPLGSQEGDKTNRAEDMQFVKEIHFLEETGREPNVVEQIEMSPNLTAQRLAQDLDLYTHCAANILTLLRSLEKSGDQFDNNKVEKILGRFNLNNEYSDVLSRINADLSELQNHLRKQVGEERYFAEVLPQTKTLEGHLKEASEFYRTGGESGEPLE